MTRVRLLLNCASNWFLVCFRWFRFCLQFSFFSTWLDFSAVIMLTFTFLNSKLFVSSISLVKQTILFVLDHEVCQSWENQKNILRIQVFLNGLQVVLVQVLFENLLGNPDQPSKFIENYELVVLLNLEQLSAHYVVVQAFKQVPQLGLRRLDESPFFQIKRNEGSVDVLTAALVDVGLNQQVVERTVVVRH